MSAARPQRVALPPGCDQLPHERQYLLKGGRRTSRCWRNTLRVVVIGGAGLFADGWDLQATTFVVAVLTYKYPGTIPTHKESLVGSATLVGAIVGEFGFGVLSDVFGRKWSALATAFLSISGMVASGCMNNDGYFSITECVAACFFVAGVGVGGEYPLSAAMSKEIEDNLYFNRLQLLQINCVLLNLGCMLQSLFCFVLLSAHATLETTWRACVFVGALPSLLAFAFRLYWSELETPHPRGRRLSSYYQSGISMFSSSSAIIFYSSLAWLLFAFGGYGLNEFSHTISQYLWGENKEDIIVTLKRATVFDFSLACCRFAGNLICACLVREGASLKQIQWAGLWCMAMFVWLCCFCGQIEWLSTVFFFLTSVMDGIVIITMYTLSTISFPKAVRGTAVGVIAGMGKIGATAGIALFPFMNKSAGMTWTIFINGAVISLGACASMLLPRMGMLPD